MKKLIYILFVLITIAFVVAAIAGFATGRINPEGKEWISFPGLVLLPVLAVNLCLFLMWCVFRSHWCWVPLAALLLNWEFLISMFRTRFCPNGGAKSNCRTFSAKIRIAWSSAFSFEAAANSLSMEGRRSLL